MNGLISLLGQDPKPQVGDVTLGQLVLDSLQDRAFLEIEFLERDGVGRKNLQDALVDLTNANRRLKFLADGSGHGRLQLVPHGDLCVATSRHQLANKGTDGLGLML